MKNRAWAERGGQSANHSSKRAQRKRILHWLKYCGQLTAESIAFDTGIPRAHVSIRLAELVLDGLVEEPGGAGIFKAVPEALLEKRKRQPALFEI